MHPACHIIDNGHAQGEPRVLLMPVSCLLVLTCVLANAVQVLVSVADSLAPELVFVLTGFPCLVAHKVMVYKPDNPAQSKLAYRHTRQ